VNAVTLKDAKLNLERLIERVIADAEPTIVVTESGEQVVLLPLDEYNSWKKRLLERTRGQATSGLSTEEIMALTRQES
jgi:prevent-host-death family protein